MLDALNRTHAAPPSAVAPSPLPAPAPDLPVVDAVKCRDEEAVSETDPAIPFIEVGGPRSSMEASPDVLAAPGPSPLVPATPEVEPDEAAPAVVSIWCSWTLRPGVKRAK
jgi:hypothetical protein